MECQDEAFCPHHNTFFSVFIFVDSIQIRKHQDAVDTVYILMYGVVHVLHMQPERLYSLHIEHVYKYHD